MIKRPSLLFAVALLATLSACKKKVDENAVMPAGDGATLVGTWSTDGSVDFSGEGLRTSMANGRTVYHPDRTFDYSGHLTIFGNALPTQGLSFAVTGKGRWQHEGTHLSEDYTTVAIKSEGGGAAIDRLAAQLSKEMQDQPATESTVVELTSGRLQLRDDVTERTTTFTRQPIG